MMSFDDELKQSRSSQRFDRADGGLKDKKEQRMLKPGSKEKLQKLKLNVLKQELDKKDDKVISDMGTKSLEDKVQESKKGIKAKEGPKNLIQKSIEQQQMEKQTSYEKNQKAQG